MSIQTIYKCDCGRPWCEYYDADTDTSYTEGGLLELRAKHQEKLADINVALTQHIEHLQSELRGEE